MTPTRSYLIKRHTIQRAALLAFAATQSPLVAGIFTGLTLTFGALKTIGIQREWKVFATSKIEFPKLLETEVDDIKKDAIATMLATVSIVGICYGAIRIFSDHPFVPKVIAGAIGFFVGQFFGELGAFGFLILRNGSQRRADG